MSFLYTSASDGSGLHGGLVASRTLVLIPDVGSSRPNTTLLDSETDALLYAGFNTSVLDEKVVL